MNSSKLLLLLTKLDYKELQKFQKFVASPYFNMQANLSHLLQIIMDQYPIVDANTDALKKKIVFEQLFIGEPYQAEKMRSVMSALYRLLERFLVQEELEVYNPHKDSILLQIYANHGLDKAFSSQLKRSEKRLTNYPFQDEQYHLASFLVKEQAYQFSLFSKAQAIEGSLQEVVDNLDAYYLVNKLRYLGAMINRKNVAAGEYTMFFYKELQQVLPNSQLLQNDAIRAYYQLLQLFTANNKTEELALFWEIRNGLQQQSYQLPPLDLSALYTGIVNVCSNRIKSGDLTFTAHLFDIYKEMISTNIIYNNGLIHQNHYRNIVSLGLNYAEQQWNFDFINDHKDRLPKKDKESTYKYCLAQYYYYYQDYASAMKFLRDVPFNNTVLHVTAKKLLLSCYFELGETAPIQSLASNFRDLLKRNKADLSSKNYEGYRNFIKYTLKIYRIKNSRNTKLNLKRSQLKATQQELESLTAIIDKEWLLKKCGNSK